LKISYARFWLCWFAVSGLGLFTPLCLGDTSATAVNPNPPAGETIGSPPFELTRSARSNLPEPQVIFDHLHGWTIAISGDADVTLRASTEERIWQSSVARLSYARGSMPTTAIIRPPKPILIKDSFDAAKLWVFGGYYRQGQSDKHPPTMAVLLEDANGKRWRIECGTVVSGNWSIQQGVLPTRALGRDNFPMKFTAVEVGSLEYPEGDSKLYIESLTFYKQQRNPTRHPFQPLNAGVPTSDAGMLPTPPPDITNQVQQITGGVRFISKNIAGSLTYDVKPQEGFLEGISAQWNDGKVFQPSAGGSLLVESRGDEVAKLGAGAQVIGENLGGNSYKVIFQQENAGKPVEWSATYTLSGRTLAVDVSCVGGAATGLDFGQVAGLNNPKPVFVPYMVFERIGHVHTAGPMIACASDVFVSVLPDVYHSDFSTIDNTPSPVQDGKIRLFTGTTYAPLTNGKRNDLHDRIMITASPQFEDILPNARNPIATNYVKMADYMLFSTYIPSLEMFSAIRRLGVDNVIVMDKNSCLVYGVGYENISSFGMRWRPMPSVSITQFQDYVREIKSLGYKFSHYSYFPDSSPTNEFWDESKVSLRSDGALAVGNWYGDFSTKMNDESRLVSVLGPLVKDLYAPDCTYLDILTNLGPSATDFEAGVAGAGVGRVAMLANADAMLEAHKFYGMTISEGYHRWLYAGCVDTDFATMLYPPPYKSASEVPPLVDFDLLKIHPFEHGVMMSFEPKYFLEEEGAEWNELLTEDGHGIAPLGFYKYLATSIAYGHMATLGYDYVPNPTRVIQLYALLQAAQREYLTDSVRDISYEDGNTYYSSSDALRRGIVENGHVRVTYTHGLVIHANLGHSESWTVTGVGRSYELPPYGWLIEKPGELLGYSAVIDGGRVDALHCEGYTYVNTGDHAVTLPEWGMSVQGAVWIKSAPGGALQVIPCGDLGRWEKIHPDGWPPEFHTVRLGKSAANRGLQSLNLDISHWFNAHKKIMVSARALDSSEIPASASPESGTITIKGQEQTVDYVLTPSPE
jgi:hypothetical protein